MTKIRIAAGAAMIAALAACAHPSNVPGDKSVDRGFNAHKLSTMKAGIWVDPNGCQHWIIDDGLEGYMDARLDPYGRPICGDFAGPPNTANGPFKSGSPVPDPKRSPDNKPVASLPGIPS